MSARYYEIMEPSEGWRKKDSFSEEERVKLRPIADTLAMLDGNAFFGLAGDDEHWGDQYLPEAAELYEQNGGDDGWAGRGSFIKKSTENTT